MSPSYHSYPSSSDSSSSTLTPIDDAYPCRRMDLADLEFLKLISGGGSGKVYLVRDCVEGQYLALKVMPKKRELNTVNNILNERYIQSMLSLEDDRYFVPLVASWHDEVNYYIATEYFPGGDLALQLAKDKIFSEERVRFYTCEIILALEQLHARKIIHRDLKPSNILLKADGHIALGDFGISRHFASRDVSSPVFERESMHSSIFMCRGYVDTPCCTTSDDCGTSYYMAPEQHMCERYSFEVDYWALGVTLYRMLTGQMPFGHAVASKHEIASSVVEDELTFPETVYISPESREFIHGLLAKDPGERIHISEIKKDPFFEGVNWKAVSKSQLPLSWRPFIPPNPRRAYTPPFEYGTPSDFHSDPLPEFSWYRSPNLCCKDSYVPSPSRTHSFSKLIGPLKRGLGTLFSNTKGKTRQRRR